MKVINIVVVPQLIVTSFNIQHSTFNSTATYRYERFRAISSGILETAGVTFLLLIAVRGFHAGATTKALIAGGGSVGLLLTPWVVSHVETCGWKVSQAASAITGIGAIAFLIAAWVPLLPVFAICSIIGMTASSAIIPLLTQIYQENYPEAQRGKLFSNTIFIRIGVAMIFSGLGGYLLSGHIERFPLLLIFFAAAFCFSSFCLSRCPSRPLTASGGGTHPFRALRFVKEDKLFRWILICWMLMGFANLMMLPLRVEYLANPHFGLKLGTSTIALLTGVLPNLARLLVSPIWGWLFDRMNFFVLRIILNLGFALGILSFFTGTTLQALIFGAIIFGISNAGGDVAWSLWVIKFAPPARVADYMSVHTFFTGLRGVLAPLVAFHMVTNLSIGTFGFISAGMILLASLMLIPEIHWGKATRPATVTIKEISE